MNWEPILQKEQKKAVEKKLLQLKEILEEQSNKEENIGLLGGQTGIAFFFLYYSKLINKQEPYDHGLELLSSVFEGINNGYNYHTHGRGLAGIGSVIELLSKHDFLEVDTNGLLGDLDEFLYKSMIYEIENENYDFLHGALGIAFYFLKRKSNKNSKIYLAELVNKLDKIAVNDEQGIRWFSELDREKHTKGFNLSLSHGLASIIAVLSKIYLEGIEKEKTFELLEGSVKYLLNQRQDSSKYESSFPSWICETESSTNSRLAWCYGDLGVGNALWVAGNNTNNREWKSIAVEVLLHTTKRKSNSETGVVDTGICHGSAGIAHIYNRMYNYTKIDDFKAAAEFWLNKTLDMAIHKDTLSGFKAIRTEKYGGTYEDFGFLEGIAGIGLSLISAVSDIEPAWDECLLLS